MYPLIFVLGIIIGSFLNVCIYRIPREESIAFPSSHCTACSHPLKWYDLIPLFSYLTLHGKCRYCKGEISLQYPMIEALNGILYLITFHFYGLSLQFIFYSIILSILIAISLIDYYHKIIPDGLTLMIFIVTIVYKAVNLFAFGVPLHIWENVFGLLAGGVLFFLIAIVSNGGMGGGDIKLIAALGFILGLKKTLLNILLSFIIGAVFSIFLLFMRKKGKKDEIPFGPFINISFLITILFGDRMIFWYIQSFLI